MNNVLYYPYFCPSAEWLRLSALCWDKVYRIKPWNGPSDPPEIEEIDEVLGILESVDPSKPNYIRKNKLSWFSTKITVPDQFERYLKNRSAILKETLNSSADGESLAGSIGLYNSKFPDYTIIKILKKYNLIKFNAVEIPEPIEYWWKWELEYIKKKYSEIPTPHSWIGGLYRRKEVYVPSPESDYSEYKKFSELMKEGKDLKKKGKLEEGSALIKKAVEIRDRNRIAGPSYREEIILPKDVAFHYLSLLSTKLATDLNCDLFTDKQHFADTIFSDQRRLRGEIATSILDAHLPANLQNMELARLADFRSEFSSQRLRYEKEVQSLVAEFSGVASEGELNRIKKYILEIGLQRVNETKQTYRNAKIEMVVKSFSLSLTPPALVATLASTLGIGIFAPAGIAAAIAFIGANNYLGWKKASLDKQKSPWSYVLDASKI